MEYHDTSPMMTASQESPGQANLPTPISTDSFWHSQASSVLLGHRTTSSLPTSADIIIIGSGISGASAAHFLSSDARGKGLKILMLEAREACWGATGRNGGHCQPLLYQPPEIGRFEMRNYETIKALIEKHDIPCDWRSLTGVHAYMSKSMFLEALQAVERVQKLDPELAKQVAVVTKDSKNPSLDDLRIPNAAGALVQSHAASLWPYKLVAWLLESLISQNSDSLNPAFNLQTKTPVTRLQHLQNGSWIVHTPRGMVASKKVLLTTNAYTSALLPEFSDLIVPVKGEMSSLLPPPSTPPICSRSLKLDHSYVFIGHGKQNINQDDYLVQRPEFDGKGGELMFGGARSEAPNAGLGNSDDSTIDPHAATYLRRELPIVLDLQSSGGDGIAQTEELKATYEWTGIMGFSRDSHPWVGELRSDVGVGGAEGLWISGGFTGHGMPNATLCAKAVVELMLGTNESEDVDYLPVCYRVSKERVQAARTLAEVHIADADGTLWHY